MTALKREVEDASGVEEDREERWEGSTEASTTATGREETAGRDEEVPTSFIFQLFLTGFWKRWKKNPGVFRKKKTLTLRTLSNLGKKKSLSKGSFIAHCVLSLHSQPSMARVR